MAFVIPMVTMTGGMSPLKRVILYPKRERLPITQITTMPIIKKEKNTARKERKKKKKKNENNEKGKNHGAEGTEKQKHNDARYKRREIQKNIEFVLYLFGNDRSNERDAGDMSFDAACFGKFGRGLLNGVRERHALFGIDVVFIDRDNQQGRAVLRID